MRCKWTIVATVMMAILATVPPSARAKVVSVDGSDFTFELPDDWQPIPQDELDAFVRSSTNPGNTFRYSGGFEPASHTQHFQFPYLLISFKYYPQHHTTITESDLRALTSLTAGVSEEELKKSLDPTVAAQLTLSGITASYFTAPPGFLIDMNVNTPAGLAHVHRLGYFCQARAIGLDFTTLATDYPLLQPIIEKAASSFKLSPSEEVAFMRSAPERSNNVIGIAFILAFIAGVTVMVVAVRRTFRRSR